MSLLLFNTLTRKKEIFRPIHPPEVKMYCCGPTVYDFLHIGNFRGAVFYNFLRFWLEHLGFKVRFYYNFTDIDDKIIKKAQQENSNSKDISQKYIKEFFKDFNQLKLRPHEGNPKATQFIPQMIRLIQNLINNNKAYEKDGHVFYRIRSFRKYGQLSGRRSDDLYVDPAESHFAESKENKEDFALWKKSKEGEPYWDSPWGKGRPGWHIECTVMIHHCLGDQIDIHGGGLDLVFPHHENEIAQSEGVKAKSVKEEPVKEEPFVKYWIHHNMFEFEGEKISKSLGTTKTMRTFLEQYNGEVFKYLVLSSHYRSVSEVSQNTVLQALSALSRIYQSLLKAQTIVKEDLSVKKNISSQFEKNTSASTQDVTKKIMETKNEVEMALNDDLNTAKALGSCFSLVRYFNDQEKSVYFAELFLKFFKEYGRIFSLFQEEPEFFLNQLDDILLKKSPLNKNEINGLIEQRRKARDQKNFKQADEIRKHLNSHGVEIQDSADHTSWRMNPSLF